MRDLITLRAGFIRQDHKESFKDYGMLFVRFFVLCYHIVKSEFFPEDISVEEWGKLQSSWREFLSSLKVQKIYGTLK